MISAIKESITRICNVSLKLPKCFLFQEINLNNRLLIYGLPSMIIMFLMILKFQNLKLSKFILMLGAGSYSLYLTHPYIIQFFDRFTNWVSGDFLQKSLSIFYV